MSKLSIKQQIAIAAFYAAVMQKNKKGYELRFERRRAEQIVGTGTLKSLIKRGYLLEHGGWVEAKYGLMDVGAEYAKKHHAFSAPNFGAIGTDGIALFPANDLKACAHLHRSLLAEAFEDLNAAAPVPDDTAELPRVSQFTDAPQPETAAETVTEAADELAERFEAWYDAAPEDDDDPCPACGGDGLGDYVEGIDGPGYFESCGLCYGTGVRTEDDIADDDPDEFPGPDADLTTGRKVTTCPWCEGDGVIYSNAPDSELNEDFVACPKCGGQGWLDDDDDQQADPVPAGGPDGGLSPGMIDLQYQIFDHMQQAEYYEKSFAPTPTEEHARLALAALMEMLLRAVTDWDKLALENAIIHVNRAVHAATKCRAEWDAAEARKNRQWSANNLRNRYMNDVAKALMSRGIEIPEAKRIADYAAANLSPDKIRAYYERIGQPVGADGR